MDTYTKGVLTVIAIALVSISFQLSQTDVIQKAKAHGNDHVHGVSNILGLEHTLEFLKEHTHPNIFNKDR